MKHSTPMMAARARNAGAGLWTGVKSYPASTFSRAFARGRQNAMMGGPGYVGARDQRPRLRRYSDTVGSRIGDLFATAVPGGFKPDWQRSIG